jgi:peptidoglycan/xylan/chitin deacetylase (PgdA/CDA1 family)
MKKHLATLKINPPQCILAIAVSLGCAGFWLAPLSVGGTFTAVTQPARMTHKMITDNELVESDVRLPSKPLARSVDCGKVACLALTFDDGPNPISTPQVLDVLEREHVPATFFVVGSRVAGQEHILRRMFYDGDEIGNHSWSHPDLTTLTNDQILQQVNRTQAAVIGAGLPAPVLFRPPYGAVNATVKSAVPMTLAMWNVDPLDWKEKDPAKLKDIIVAQAKPGGVLDMHDIYGITAEVLGPAIDELKDKYTFVTFSELFDLQPGQRGEYFGR